MFPSSSPFLLFLFLFFVFVFYCLFRLFFGVFFFWGGGLFSFSFFFFFFNKNSFKIKRTVDISCPWNTTFTGPNSVTIRSCTPRSVKRSCRFSDTGAILSVPVALVVPR